MAPARRILLVDDDPNLCRTLADILHVKGYSPLVALRGEEACRLVKDERPDLALVDLKLPDMDGLSLVREFRQLLPGMEYILLTGHATQESAIEALNLGAYSYLEKPYDMGRLLITVQRALERRDAGEALRRSEAQYRELVQSANSIILRMDTEGRITFINEYAEKYFGYARDEILGMNAVGTIVPETESTGRSLKTMVRDIIENPDRYVANENENMRKSGERTWVFWTNRAIVDDHGVHTGILSVGSDITAVKRMEEQLRLRVRQQAAVAELGRRALAEHDLTLIMQEAAGLVADGMDVELVEVLEWVAEDELLLLLAGIGWEEGLVGRLKVGIDPGSLAGNALEANDAVTADDLQAQCDRDCMEVPIAHGAASGLAVAIPGGLAPYGVLGAYARTCRVFSEQDVLFLQSMATILGDAVVRKRAEERVERQRQELRAMASDLALAEERERHRIAVGLHDQVIQNLAVATIRLDSLRQSLHSVEARNTLQVVRDSTGAAISDLRSLTFELSPPVLYELGLEPALQYLAELMEREHGLSVRYLDDGTRKPLREELQVTLYRSARELLMNAVKHARASNVTVSVSRLGGNIHIMVGDDGAGFDAAALETRAAAGFGLLSIRERLACLGGQIAIDSEPGRGTSILLRAPLSEEDKS